LIELNLTYKKNIETQINIEIQLNRYCFDRLDNELDEILLKHRLQPSKINLLLHWRGWMWQKHHAGIFLFYFFTKKIQIFFFLLKLIS